MNLDKIKAYALIKTCDLPDINSTAFIMQHIKTGAKVLVLKNDDENKVFNIGFRTPPSDSTGLPHIMEHSVLCGSKKYPSKDPFIELAKGSLNTFLNAMTFPDKTVYPVASCNDKDFFNLLSVYLDAVFYPNIYTKEETFLQEGWHYEINDPSEDITVNGVVYNEMKGVYSSPDDVIDRYIFDSLFPDTCYGFESGGDPDCVPELTYEQFLDFHRKYYHPSNSYIYLYGNADMEGILSYIDSEYLKDYDKKDIDSKIAFQKPFGECREYVHEYSITEGESLQDNTYLSFNAVIDTSLNKELYLAFEIIEYALLGVSGAVLKEALLKSGICKDVLSTYENGIYQPYFSVIAKNANEEDKDRFIKIINEVLSDVVKNGFDKKVLLAGINSFEFKYREADFGHYPKGLMYGLQSFESWLYEGDPLLHLSENDTYSFLKKMVETDYFEKLVEKYLINSLHASFVVVKPVASLTAKKDAAFKEKMSRFKSSLSASELDELIKKTAYLKEYQEMEDSKEVLKMLPLLSIDDLGKKAQPYINREIPSDVTILKHDIFTNGIAYVKVLFNLDKVPTKDLQYVSLLKQLLGLLDTVNYSYADLASEINLNSGGINSGVSIAVKNGDSSDYVNTFEMKARVLYDKLSFSFDIINELIFNTKFEDDVRLKELINMIKSRLQSSMLSSGHMYASMRALAGVSEPSALIEYLNGISFYRFIDDIASNYDEKKEELKLKLKSLIDVIFTKENLILFDLTSDNTIDDEYKSLAETLYNRLPDKSLAKAVRTLKTEMKNEGFKTSGKVQFVAKAGSFTDDNHKYTGLLKILRVIMGYDYLWTNVRVMGGAYGCFSSFNKHGDSYFVSYRDPNLKNTLDIYDNAPEYLKSFDADERTMTKYIIGTIADLDAPLTPADKGSRSLSAYICGETYERIQKERDDILSATKEDIAGLSEYLSKILNDSVICVIGGEEIIQKEQSSFDSVEVLL